MSEPATILVCDDEGAIRGVVASKLRGAGFLVHEARNGAEGYGLVDLSSLPPGAKPRVERAVVPDLVVTDMQMPVMSGLELAQRLRLFEATRAVPVLMLTARGYIVDDEGLAKTNIRVMMPKPFSATDLLAKVRGMLERTNRSAA